MTALAQSATRSTEPVSMLTFALTGVKIFQGSRLGLILKGASKGKVTKYTATANLLYLGVAYLSGSRTPLDATSADKQVQVVLTDELRGAEWFPQGATPVASTQVGEFAYFADDNTVVPASSDLGVAVAGRILMVRTLEVLIVPPTLEMGFPVLQAMPPGPVFAFTSNDYAPAQIVNGAVYSIPTTGAASTVSLPVATALPDGLYAYIYADGTANGHAVTLRDGATGIRVAFTAAKPFLQKVIVYNGHWLAEGHPGI